MQMIYNRSDQQLLEVMKFIRDYGCYVADDALTNSPKYTETERAIVLGQLKAANDIVDAITKMLVKDPTETDKCKVIN